MTALELVAGGAAQCGEVVVLPRAEFRLKGAEDVLPGVEGVDEGWTRGGRVRVGCAVVR